MWQGINATRITKLGSTKEYDMKRCLLVIALAVFVNTIAINNSMAQSSGQSQIPTLSPTGVPKGPPEKILLKNPIIHVRINNLDRLLNDINDLLMSFVPAKAVPKQLQPFLKYEKPVLAFLGMNIAGKPLDAQTLALISGVDSRRSLSLTLYLGGKPLQFALSVPVADGKTIAGMLMNITLPRKFQRTKQGGTPYYHIKPSKHGMPENLYVACSEDYAYICSSASLTSALANAAPENRMASGDTVRAITEKYAEKDFTACLNPAVFKMFLPGLEQQLAIIMPGQIAKLRKSFLESMSESERRMMDLRIRTELGLKDTDELLDYAECFAAATYESVASSLFDLVRNFHGTGIAVNLDKQFQSIEYSCYSSDVKPLSATRPIPMNEAVKAVMFLPGELHNLAISGKQPEKRQDSLATQWTRLLQEKLEQKSLSSEVTEKLITMIREHRPTQNLESIADWTVSTRIETFELPEINDYDSVLDYLTALNKAGYMASRAVIQPAQQNNMLRQYCRSRVAAIQSNIAHADEFRETVTENEPFISREARLREQTLDKNIELFSIENIYTTTSGMFGYHEHELINRSIYASRQVDNYLLIQPGREPYGWLKEKRTSDNSKPGPAVSRLLRMAPPKANNVAVARGMHIFPEAIGLLDNLEKLLHREFDSYLESAKEALQSKDKERIDELAARMPITVKSLNRHSASGELYLVLPGEFTYPRPEVMPAASELFKDFRSKMNSIGGGMCWSRAMPGRMEGGLIHDTGAISYLFRSVINNFYEKYQASPEGRREFGKLLRGEYDGKIQEGETVLKNPLMHVEKTP